MKGKKTRKFIIKHDDLYARAWEYEKENPIFDSDYNNLVTPNWPEITVQSGEAADEMSSTPGTIRENSRDTFSSDGQIVWRNGDGSLHAAWCGYKCRATWPYAYQPPQLKIWSTSYSQAKL